MKSFYTTADVAREKHCSRKYARRACDSTHGGPLPMDVARRMDYAGFRRACKWIENDRMAKARARRGSNRATLESERGTAEMFAGNTFGVACARA